MAQVQKEAIRNLITDTALQLFAQKGYSETSIADIAKEAGISVGNVYRYFSSKKEVLEEVIPEDFISTIRKMLREKIETGKADTIFEQSRDERYILNSEHFVEFLVSNRLRFLVLLKCNKESHYANCKQEILDFLVQLFLQEFVIDPEEQEKKQAMVTILYKGFIGLCTEVLSMECEDSKRMEELKTIMNYHIYGLASLIEKK